MYDKKNTDDMVQRYKDEMMKLYRQNNPAVQGTGQSKANSISPQQNNVAGSSAGKTMGTAGSHSKLMPIQENTAELSQAQQKNHNNYVGEDMLDPVNYQNNYPTVSDISAEQNNVAGSSAGKAMGTAGSHNKFPTPYDISAEQNNVAGSSAGKAMGTAGSHSKFPTPYEISAEQNNVAGSSAGKTMGTAGGHSKFPTPADISAEQNNPPSSKFRSAEDIMKNLAVPAIAINEMPPRSVTNRDDEDTYPVEDDGSDYEKEEQTESDEEDFSDMPRPPDIEVPPEIMLMLEQNRTAEESAPFVRDRTEEYPTDITARLVNETGDTDTGYLQIEVSSANNAVPIKNAMVIISRKTNGNNYLLSVLTTDSSGRTPAVNLPAPPKTFSDESGVITPEMLHADYQVKVEAEGFYPAINEGVPVFALIKSIQPFELTPLPEYTVQPVQAFQKIN